MNRRRKLVLSVALVAVCAGVVLLVENASGPASTTRAVADELPAQNENSGRKGSYCASDTVDRLLVAIEGLQSVQRDVVQRLDEIKMVLTDLRDAAQEQRTALDEGASPEAWHTVVVSAERRLVAQEIARHRLDLLSRIVGETRRLSKGGGRVPSGESEQPLIDLARRNLQALTEALAALDHGRIRTAEDLVAWLSRSGSK